MTIFLENTRPVVHNFWFLFFYYRVVIPTSCVHEISQYGIAIFFHPLIVVGHLPVVVYYSQSV